MLSYFSSLTHLSLDELIELYIESSDLDNSDSYKLIEIVKTEQENLFGFSPIEFVDPVQMNHLNEQIGKLIIQQNCETYTTKKQKPTSTKESDKHAENKQIIIDFIEKYEHLFFSNISDFYVTHSNCYYAEIESDYIHFIVNTEDVLAVCVANNYDFTAKSYGTVRWDSIKPLDKDETTCIEFIEDKKKNHNIRVPFKDISTSGSYCINERCKTFDDGTNTLFVWYKK